MPDFKYNKSVLNKDDMDIILAGILLEKKTL